MFININGYYYSEMRCLMQESGEHREGVSQECLESNRTRILLSLGCGEAEQLVALQLVGVDRWTNG